MPIDNPDTLVHEFKESGEFERLRRELLAQFQQSEGKGKLKSQIEEKVQQRFQTDAKLRFSSQTAVHRELMLEIDRFPIVERAVGDVKAFSDSAFANNIDDKLEDMLYESKGKKTRNTRSARTREHNDSLPAKPNGGDSQSRASTSQKPPQSEVAIVVTSPTQPSQPLPPAS